MVELLMAHHANPNSVNKANKTPLKLAVSFGDQDLIQKLKAGL